MKKQNDDILDDPDFKRYARHFLDEVAPKMMESAYVITIAPTGGEADVKQAVEIGYAIMLGKPLIVLKQPGQVVAEKLLRIADHVVEGDMSTEVGRTAVGEQFKRIMNQ
jgi:nucleoside 2-deoxyribosyltransferase